MIHNFISQLGQEAILLIEKTGRASTILFVAVSNIFTPPLNLKNILKQMEEIGTKSIPVVLVTSLSTGMVLAMQSYNGFKRFGAESLVGTVVALSITRELGPVLTALIVAGRAGAAMAAELGTMKVTEQIDALATMAVNPVKYLISPRVCAGICMLPALTIFADLIGLFGGYAVSVLLLDINSVVYIERSLEHLHMDDILGGLGKALVFGLIISTVSAYKGFTTKGGAEGVGKSTTGAVVISSMLILISDYILTSLMF